MSSLLPHLRTAPSKRVNWDEERDLTPVEQALIRVRLAAFQALEAGASRADVDREVGEAVRGASRISRQP